MKSKRGRMAGVVLVMTLLVGLFSPGHLMAQDGGSTTELDLGADGPLMDVAATGVGITAENAKRNALRNSVEQAIGVMVEPDTLVEKGEVVRKEVLSDAQRFVAKSTVARRWEADRLHHVLVRSRISVNRLTVKLAAHKIPTRRIPGELLYYRTLSGIANEQAGADMLRKALADLTLDKFVKVEVVGKPRQIKKDDLTMKLRFKLRLTMDMAKWRKIYQKVTPVLQKVALKRTVFPPGSRNDAEHRMGGRGARVTFAVLRRISRSGRQRTWDGYLLPKAFSPAVLEAHDQPYELSISLTDANDKPVVQKRCPIYSNRRKLAFEFWGWRYIAPVFMVSDAQWPTSVTQEEEVEVSVDDLRRVANCIVTIKEKKP